MTARPDEGVTSDDYLDSKIDERKELLDERKKDRKASISNHWEAIESDDEFEHDANTDGNEDLNYAHGRFPEVGQKQKTERENRTERW